MDDVLEIFMRRLADVFAWCSIFAVPNDPGTSLRSAALGPPPYPPLIGAGSAAWWAYHINPEAVHHRVAIERRAVLTALANMRADLLRNRAHSPDGLPRGLAGGRLLLCESPDMSVIDGASEYDSRGFFDGDDLPPWDTWLCYVQGAERVIPVVPPAQHPRVIPAWQQSYLVSWVPPAFLPYAEAGIHVNPVDCLAWAEEIDIPFTRLLRSAELL